MSDSIKSALLSVYHKDGLDKIVQQLNNLGIKIYATGGTFDFIKALGIPVTAVEEVTGYPSILGGRVKTLHPGVFAGILAKRSEKEHQEQMEKFQLPFFDLVLVDLYPFEETVASGGTDEQIIEKIDIGGISLIRAAAKNFGDVLIIPSVKDYSFLLDILEKQGGKSTIDQRKTQAKKAFYQSSHYDEAIHNWFSIGTESAVLRYGENPHQQGIFHGKLDEVFTRLHGKELSYNNLLDIDAAINLIEEFDEPTIAIIKHNNACGIASDNQLLAAWDKALAGDPVSAFGGVIICNKPVTTPLAESMNTLFFEVLMAPGYEAGALDILKSKKNRIILQTKTYKHPDTIYRTVLNGLLEQTSDNSKESSDNMKPVTNKIPSAGEIADMMFANKIVKHSKSNAIVLAKNQQLCASGVGQTSRIDALKQAIEKAKHFGLSLEGAVMASDAFFPFPDCIKLAHEAGITAVIQPGGSIRDQDSIDEANKSGVAMVVTGLRHFKH